MGANPFLSNVRGKLSLDCNLRGDWSQHLTGSQPYKIVYNHIAKGSVTCKSNFTYCNYRVDGKYG